MALLCELDHRYALDTVEWNNNFLAVGCYQLLDNNQHKTGEILIYEFNGTDRIDQVCHLETAAVLDVKWNNRNLFAAMHDGIIMCFDHTLNWKSSYFAKDALSLALDCNSSTNSICSSYSDGKVLVFSVERAEPMAKFKVSEYEAWTCAFDRWNENLVYSGADDGGFCGWDIRSAEPAFRNLKSHSESGVVSVQSSPFTEHIVATGGYDEKLRIWDARKGFSSEMQVSKIAPNGGVWKIKWHPHDSHTLGIACMYAGLKIIRLKDDYSITEESHFAPNENSLVYGVDWNRCDSNILASCSFYDKRLRIWRRS